MQAAYGGSGARSITRAAGACVSGAERDVEGDVLRMAADGATKSAMARATGLTRPTVYAILRGGW